MMQKTPEIKFWVLISIVEQMFSYLHTPSQVVEPQFCERELHRFCEREHYFPVVSNERERESFFFFFFQLGDYFKREKCLELLN